MTWAYQLWRWLATSRAGRAVGAVMALLAATGAAYLKGRSHERTDAAHENAEDYRDERERQDDLDVGHGASDAQRIKRLLRIKRGR